MSDTESRSERQNLLLISFNGADGADMLERPISERFRVGISLVSSPLPEARTRSGQVNADDVLSEVCRLRVKANADMAIGVTDVDLYVLDMNFVFGLSSRDGACAVVSSSRLKGNGEGQLLARLVKEAFHELGHVYGLDHCDDSGCVMHFSNSLRDTDLKGSGFCSRCTAILDG